MISKLGVIFVIALGEALCIYAEIATVSAFRGALLDAQFIRPTATIIVGGLFLLLGYALAVEVFGNVWPVAVTSICLIVILEPLLILAMTGQRPNRSTAIAFGIGAAGLVLSLAG